MKRPWLAASLAFAAGLVAGPSAAIELSNLTLNGYSSFEYEKQFGSAEDGDGDPNGSFDADSIDLVFNFFPVDRVRFALDLGWEHGAATEEGRGNVLVEYGFIEYAVSDLLKLKAGKMLVPFGIYNEIHNAKVAYLTVKEPPSLNKTSRLEEGGFRYCPRWGSGLAVHGDASFGERELAYDVLVTNGDPQKDANPYEEDDDAQKAVAGRIRVEALEGLQLGYSVYHETYSGMEELVEEGDASPEALTSHGLELQYAWGNFRLWAEGAFGRLSFTEGEDHDQRSWYVQPSYTFGFGLTPYARFEWFDPNADRSDDEATVLTAGLQWEVAKQFGLKLEDNYFRGGANGERLGELPGHDYHELKAAVVLGF